MGPAEFYKGLKAISWESGPHKALNYVRKHSDSLSSKTKDGETLIQALMNLDVSQDDVDKVIKLVIDLMDPEALNEVGADEQTSLYTALYTDRKKVAEMLLKKGVDISVGDREENSLPLHAACYVGNAGATRTMLRQRLGKRLAHSQDDKGSTPLDIACFSGHLDVVTVIASMVPDTLDWTDVRGRSPLYTAVEYGHLDVVEFLANNADLIMKPDIDNVTPLDCACYSGFLDIASLLLSRGADIESRDKRGETPLLTASAAGHWEIVKLLIGRGANTTAQDNKGKTSLLEASIGGFADIVRSLLACQPVVDSIDQSSLKGETPLLTACTYGGKEIASLLLAAGADSTRASYDGETPLMAASKWRYAPIVEVLLTHKDGVVAPSLLKQKNDERDGFAALHYACYYGHIRIVKTLVHFGADVNQVDARGRNALHNATRQGYKEIVEFLSPMMNDINAVDGRGWTALHYAGSCKVNESELLEEDYLGDESFAEAQELAPIPGKHVDILQHLVRAGAHLNAVTDTGATVLHLAARSGHHSRVGVLLGSPGNVKDLILIRDSDYKTALYDAMKQENPHIVRQLLARMDTADLGEVMDRENLMVWLAKSQATHDLACLLLTKDMTGSTRPPSSASTWGALEWSAYRGYPKLLWWLLFSGNPNPERDRRIKTAEGIAKGFVVRRSDRGHVSDAKDAESETKEKRHDRQGGTESKQLVSTLTDVEDSHLQVLMILRNPPMTQTVGQKPQLKHSSDKPLHLPHSLDLISKYQAQIVDFYGFAECSGFLRRFSSLKDVIYVRGPAQIMSEARERTHKLDAKYGPKDGSAANTWDESDINVRWIHLPANNMKWMSDLALTVSGDSDIDSHGLSWFNRSWDQVLGKSRSSRFMKPRCVYRMKSDSGDNEDNGDENDENEGEEDDSDEDDSYDGDGDEDEDENEEDDGGDDEEDGDGGEEDVDEADDENNENAATQVAIYMPYLTLAKHWRDPQQFSPEYDELLNDYSDAVIHGSRTLDEFFYQSCEGESLRQDILHRNQDQVLSKTIHHGSVSDLDSWVLINVDQLWIWVIDDKTIITSSTHRKDGVEDPLLTTILEDLSHAAEMRTGRRGPTNTFEMSRFIIDTCVGFFDRGFEMKIDSGEGGPPGNWKGSVQDIFSNALAQAALRESALYAQFALNERSTRPDNSQASKQSTGVLEAANLFREIKDIRDELKMLRTIAEYQRSVQTDAPDLSSLSKTVSSEAMATGLYEMDKAAARIENAVNVTLTLEQNEISIGQAQEAVTQGRTLMLFTGVTILFLPLSFFTSLFALDVASFQQTPTWAFLVLFFVSFSIFTPLSIYAFYSDGVIALYYKLVAYVKGGEKPKVIPSDALALRLAKRRGSFQTDPIGRNRPSTGRSVVFSDNTRSGMVRRSRMSTFYDEESLTHKAHDV